ncbi:hypothetical protein NVV81_26450, partial [Pseudomonas carnis]|nr:hypothetical protein [Pseudomonas carnis]
MLAKNVNDNAGVLNERGVDEFFASKLAPTKKQLFEYNQAIGQFVAGLGNGHMHLEQLATGF